MCTFQVNHFPCGLILGQPRQHGFQTLGKVVPTRRVPQPANLPSLKKENLGNDPRIALVPTGSQGWGAKDRQTPPQKPTEATPPSVFCITLPLILSIFNKYLKEN